MAKIIMINSHMIHVKKCCSSSLVIKYPPQPNHNRPHCLHLENNIYIYIQIGGGISHTTQCVKLRELIKVMREIFDINSVEQKYVIIRWVLQPKQL